MFSGCGVRGDIPTVQRSVSAAAIAGAGGRRDLLIITFLICAMIVLISNGSGIIQQINGVTGGRINDGLHLASVALLLNVALILFGWRRYVDLQHEAEMRVDGERRAALAAATDPMTGLNNRKGFVDKGQLLREAAVARGEWLVILSIQMHRFKSVNDRHGYEYGDVLLSDIAEALCVALPTDAVVARLGGDEFAVAMSLAPGALGEAEQLAEDVLRAVTRPFAISDKLLQVGAFVGIVAQAPAEARVSDLLRRADIAMDHAKTGRSARPVWFDASMESALIASSEIEQGMRYGLEHDQFVPFFEPQVDLATGEIVGFEVLARWRHPLRGIILPDLFIPIAEEIGVIGSLSERVIRQALAMAVDWDPAIKISVNISPTQLADIWFAQKIVRLLTESGFPADRLVVEITESSLFADIDLARSIVTSLKNQGIRLALDDFGTGFSSLAHLRALPFDVIKVDRSFVSNMTHDHESAAIVRAVAALANAIGVPVTVEGIEDAATHAAVLGYGCNLGQGWYFGKPMTGEQAEHLLRSRRVSKASARHTNHVSARRAATG